MSQQEQSPSKHTDIRQCGHEWDIFVIFQIRIPICFEQMDVKRFVRTPHPIFYRLLPKYQISVILIVYNAITILVVLYLKRSFTIPEHLLNSPFYIEQLFCCIFSSPSERLA
jgi:hypothetical protein